MAHVVVGVIAADTGTALWAVLLGEGAPLIAALIVSIILARAGFHEKLSEYRQDTLTLVQMRAETMEKQLEETRTELEEVRRTSRRRARRIEFLEMELEDHHPAPKAAVRPARPRVAEAVDDDDLDEEKP